MQKTRCPNNPANADKIDAAKMDKQARSTKRQTGDGLDTGEASKIRVLTTSTDANALVLAFSDDVLSDLTM
jgi:hypothetical protein